MVFRHYPLDLDPDFLKLISLNHVGHLLNLLALRSLVDLVVREHDACEKSDCVADCAKPRSKRAVDFEHGCTLRLMDEIIPNVPHAWEQKQNRFRRSINQFQKGPGLGEENLKQVAKVIRKLVTRQ